MQILCLLGMYFDAVVVEVEKYLLFFRLALAILWRMTCNYIFNKRGLFSQLLKDTNRYVLALCNICNMTIGNVPYFSKSCVNGLCLPIFKIQFVTYHVNFRIMSIYSLFIYKCHNLCI